MNLFLVLSNIQIAASAIRANKIRAFLTILGIIIGVFSVTLMISLVKGLDEQIKTQITDLGPELMKISPGNIEDEGFTFGSPPGISDRIEKKDVDLVRKEIPEIEYLTEVRQTTGETSYRGKTKKGVVIGVDPDFINVFNYKLEGGEVFHRGEDGKIAILGNGIAKELFSNPLASLDKEIKVKGSQFKVIGVLNEKEFTMGSISMNDAVFVPAETAEREFKAVIFEVDFLAPSEESVPLIERRVEKLLEESHGKKDFSVLTSEETINFVNTITGFITVVLSAITGISLLVGGIGIMNIMLVSVTERTKEIGIRKALGATNLQILFQFLVEASTLSVLGGILGLALAYAGSSAVTKFADFPTNITLNTVALAIGFSAFVGVLFGTAPAIKAARKDPIEALRYE